MAILLIAEHDNLTLNDATLSAVTAARALGAPVHLLVAGSDCRAVAEQAAHIAGVDKVLLADAEPYRHHLAEHLARLAAELADGHSHVLAAATAAGRDLLPRVAALLDVAQISDVIGIEAADTFRRPIYAGNAIATVQSLESRQVLTVRATAFVAAPVEGGSAVIETVTALHRHPRVRFVGEQRALSERPELASARIVVSGGRGLGSAENFALVERLADRLGAAVGASRAAVDAGFAANSLQVGQTGKIVAPDLYIALGISGAIQHLAGMSGAKVIVAINKDEEAPIFQVASYGLVGDIFETVPALEAALASALEARSQEA
ncbi:electron transfer flavoprotein subunit alpha/FixB family protein [Stutzerimonas stutzeri]|uniref:electron transfer flavoprotein subunit alpha/FixB family protein n=1 Tax=Stutzerimonas stutzeri TaxID=316 RepID=UPI0015E2CA74|nr:FAD-binding protein [Stutzerimonas stutzeri]MBA1264459.1 electron transfer flavoprotein subunit alpha/FixB family protein [Stutzerimonas stutzeri]